MAKQNKEEEEENRGKGEARRWSQRGEGEQQRVRNKQGKIFMTAVASPAYNEHPALGQSERRRRGAKVALRVCKDFHWQVNLRI